MTKLVHRLLAVTALYFLCSKLRLENSQDRHEDASSDSGSRRPDDHEEVDNERRQTDVVVEEIMRVSRPQKG